MIFEGRDIKVVWLDLDDTLIDFHANSRVALRRVYEARDLKRVFATADEWIDCYEGHNKSLWEQYSRAEVTQDYLRLQRFKLPLVEGGMDAEEAHSLSLAMDSEYLDYLAQEKRLMLGAIELLEALRRKDVTIGVLSNGFREVQHRKIVSAGLQSYIDCVVLSDDIGINKPDARIYQYAMERVGDLDPSHHLMIGDNPATDIAGAINAGWAAELYDGKIFLRFE